jgi:iron complex outermembrane recepter protein
MVLHAEEASSSLEEVVVTAQKRSESMQEVPIAITALGTEKLEQLNVANLDDYVKLLPNVAYVRGRGQGGNGQPGSSQIYMRGVVSGGDGNRAGSQPSVGVYLDEQPVTTTSGSLDVHVYDVARVEVLAGPQGTLYGASSQAGTIRLITNKPDASAFSGAVNGGVNSVAHGGTGYEAEGFVNIPLAPWAALRVVGWADRDAGFIDNVAGSNPQGCIVNGVRTFPTWAGQPAGRAAPCPTPTTIGAGSISNAAFVEDDYNTVDTYGGRAALKIDLNDSWTITPTVMGQSVSSEGSFGYDPVVGDLEVAHFSSESAEDSWVQAALTVEGKISNLDVVYAGAFLQRDLDSIADYSDYSLFYDRLFGSGAYWQGNDLEPIDPQALIVSKDEFQKWSQELRISTPTDWVVSATAGVFVQRQLHNFRLQYVLPGYGYGNPTGGNPGGFATSLSVPGMQNTLWLTNQQRVDRDRALFAQATWTIDTQWSLTGGIRFFESDNSQRGFFGYSLNFDRLLGYVGPGVPANPPPGMANCGGRGLALTTFQPFKGAPCTNISNSVKQTGHVPRVNLTYRVTDDHMVYATYSKGFRPGGVNRISDESLGGPYQPDYLINYEMGWKTEWLGSTLRFNGALFWEDWENFQFSFLGPFSGTIITNGGQARIKGIETDLEWAATDALTLSTSFTFLDARLQENYCGVAGVTECPNLATQIPFAPGGPTTVTGPLAREGARLPVTPRFKGNVLGRYQLEEIAGWEPHVQGAFTYQTKTASLLRTVDQMVVGTQPAYGLFDLSAGIRKESFDIQLAVTNVFDRRAELTRFVQCKVTVCEQPYVITAQPRTFAVRLGTRF